MHNDSRAAETTVRNWFSTDSTASQPGTGNESLAHSISNVIHSIKANRWLILALMMMGACAGIFKAVTEMPVYQAKLTMAVEPNSSRLNQQSMFDPYAFRFYETQYELLKSRSVAEKVVDRLDLVQHNAIEELLVSPGFFELLLREVAGLAGVELAQTSSVDKPGANIDENKKREWLTNIIQGGVNVYGGEKTNLVTVTFNSTNPDFAAQIANALVDAYIELGLESQQNRSQQTSLWLSQRLVEVKQSLNDAEQRLQTFLLDEGMLESTKFNAITTNELNALNQEYLSARANYEELAKRYGQRHPRISDALAEMNAAKARLDRKSKNLTSSTLKSFELSRMERDVEVNRELYEAFLTKFKESDLSNSGSQIASARVVDKALPPAAALYPNKQRIILTWTFGGLLIGIMIAFIREQLDSTFKSGRIVEEKLGLPLLGVIQSMKMEDESQVERYYLENNRSVFSEAINHIRTGITYSNVDNPPKVIVITSSVQSEGKTTVASNLALSYAQLGPTLLIDVDLRRPRIKHIVKDETGLGLVDYVAGVAELKDCINEDKELKNLFILNSGTTPPNPLELIASDKFKSIIQALRSKFAYIIVDTAPVLPASDAIILGQMADALLMVIQSDRTTHHMARDAIKRLNSSKVDVTGLILTQANIEKSGSYKYGGYYGYGAYSYTYVEDND